MVSLPWKQLRRHKLQQRLWTTTARFTAVAAGRGSGKTELARRRVVRFLPVTKPWPDPLYFYALPTYSQAKRVAWDPILQLIPREWIKSANKSELCVETIFGSKLYIVGMDKPERIEGVQWDGGVIDESSDQRPKAFDRSVMPALSHRDAWCWRIGVPKRFGIGAREFRQFFNLGLQGLTIPGTNIKVESYSWPSADIIEPSALAAARALLDEIDFREQYEASWEDVGGTVFHSFDRETNVKRCDYVRDLPILVGSDFNVNPMCWTLAHSINDRILVVFDEIFIRNTNTQATLDYLAKKYSSHTAGWEFYGDASGGARKTSATFTDVAMIKNDERFLNKKVKYYKSNPPVLDRFAATNALLKNAQGVSRLFIDPSCTHLIADLEDRAFKEGTRTPDEGGDIGHITDALGYIVYRRFPIRLNAQPMSVG